jgi:hypothetical protein
LSPRAHIPFFTRKSGNSGINAGKSAGPVTRVTLAPATHTYVQVVGTPRGTVRPYRRFHRDRNAGEHAMTRHIRNTMVAIALAMPPTLLALAVSLPQSYWL